MADISRGGIARPSEVVDAAYFRILGGLLTFALLIYSLEH